MANSILSLSTPWAIYFRQIEALFKEDPEIRVTFDNEIEEEKEIKIYVENQDKADALAELLPEEKEFGNVVVKVTIIPANVEENTTLKLIERAFRGNPALKYIKSTEPSATAYSADYVVFKKQVVQYFNDSLADVNGQCSTLYQELAKEVIELKDGEIVYFCTDSE